MKMQTKPFRIGTRSSPLALVHALETRSRLMAAHKLPEDAFEIVSLSTKGDRIINQQLHEIGGKGLFTQEIEEKLASGNLDLAVHSAKDMPTKLPENLQLLACLPREDVRDVFISRTVKCLQDIPINGVIGTSSLRRQALLHRWRSDVIVAGFRGQIETRLRKLAEGEADGILLAYAGLKRLQKTDIATEILDLEEFLPAPTQGAICIETRKDDMRIQELVIAINHPETWDAIICERAFLASLDGSCRTPIAGYAYCENQEIYFSGMILTPDGVIVHRICKNGKRCHAMHIGYEAGRNIRAIAGENFFKVWQ